MRFASYTRVNPDFASTTASPALIRQGIQWYAQERNPDTSRLRAALTQPNPSPTQYLLDAPNETNSWTNILYQYFVLRIDPTPTGHTNGFSEFVVAALGSTNPQGPATLALNAPLRNQDPKVFPIGAAIPVSFTLASTHHAGAVTDATASISVVMTAAASGTRTPVIVFSQQNAFVFTNGGYSFTIPSQGFRAGTCSLTVYGTAFPATAVSFTIH
jgi:hypothetical protein